ncbi:hypothetical protein EDC94DRAFT_620811 [Helicostylum pulchrum]|nr:hypothetical protein EDC94DRAFT_620811 [Helicostylum pulchrum]
MAAEMKKEGLLLVKYLSLYTIKPISKYGFFIIFLQDMLKFFMYSAWAFFVLEILLFLDSCSSCTFCSVSNYLFCLDL